MDVRLIWSTYPIATAHLIGLCLCKLSGLPWVADFRDPMIDEVHPTGTVKRKIFRWIERKTLSHASGVCFTTPGALDYYKNHYPNLDSSRWVCIQNGYDDQDFDSIAASSPQSDETKNDQNRPITLVHSGTLYPLERNPECFFSALAQLKSKGDISAGNFCVILRATGHDDVITEALKLHRIEDLVLLKQNIEHRQALREICEADGLLLLQASNCNHQIPAKLYEYMRAGRPLLALTDSGGDTAKLIQEENAGIVVDLCREDAVIQGLKSLLATIKSSDFKAVSTERLHRYRRQNQSAQLAEFLTAVASKA